MRVSMTTPPSVSEARRSRGVDWGALASRHSKAVFLHQKGPKFQKFGFGSPHVAEETKPVALTHFSPGLRWRCRAEQARFALPRRPGPRRPRREQVAEVIALVP